MITIGERESNYVSKIVSENNLRKEKKGIYVKFLTIFGFPAMTPITIGRFSCFHNLHGTRKGVQESIFKESK